MRVADGIARVRRLRVTATPGAVAQRGAEIASVPVRAASAAVLRRMRPREFDVSVVVAAYNSDPGGLRRLVLSLDEQTMPRRKFELIVVDDGSTDDTLRRLRRMARTRAHMVVHSIPNSGWSSRPRNVATGMARGRYVLFADHDDVLFPEALQRASDLGVATAADVVNPKEVRSRGWSWGWAEFAANLRPGETGSGVPLAPMTPHKFYRREFLDRHDIRFPEGRRVLWEDIHFNVACLAAGARVAVLADYPVYHWVSTRQNNSGTFGRDLSELWDNLGRLLAGIDTVLAGNPWRRPLMTLQLRGRVLDAVGPRLLKRAPDNRVIARDSAREVLERFAPAVLEERLTPVDRVRRDVLRSGDIEDQVALAEHDQGISAATQVEDVHWEDGLLVVTATATLVHGPGRPVRLCQDGGRWSFVLPERFGGVVRGESLDVTDALPQAAFTISVRGRRSRSTWPVPGDSRVEIVPQPDGTGIVTASARARFDFGRTPERHWDDDPVWDFGARLEALGHVRHGPLLGGRKTVAVVDGRTAVAYRNASGALSLDVSSTVRGLAEATRFRPEDAEVTVARAGRRPLVELTARPAGLHVHGEAAARGHLLVGNGTRLPATLEDDGGRAVLRARGRVRAGRHELRMRFDERTAETGLLLEVGADSVVLSTEPAVAGS